MTPQKFVQKPQFLPALFVSKWLPNCHDRCREYLHHVGKSDRAFMDFIHDNFQEALENFAKAQREIVLKRIEGKYIGLNFDIEPIILNAPMP